MPSATARSSQSRTTEETSQVAAPRRARRTTRRRCSASPRCPRLRTIARRRSPPPISRCTTRSRSIAREHGFASWNALREEVEARTLSFDAAVDEFIRCATGGAPGRAERLLALHPRIASATLQTALVLGDAAAVEARLRDHPELATQPGGPQNGSRCSTRATPACTAAIRRALDGLVAIARRLCALGANPNAEYHWNWHPELPRTALWARDLRRPPPAAGGGAARGRRESDRRRHGAHRRRRRQPRRARAAAPLRRERRTAFRAACRRSST